MNPAINADEAGSKKEKTKAVPIPFFTRVGALLFYRFPYSYVLHVKPKEYFILFV
jgi:hypothetical protein